MKKAKYFLLLISILLFFACKSNITDSSFTAKLDSFDNYLINGKVDEALKSLKSAKRTARTPIQYLAITKRYIKISDSKNTLKVLKKASKLFKNNPEINAVYTKQLIKNKKDKLASVQAKKLVGTKYSSIISEIVFSKIQNESDFYELKQIPYYINAYNTTGNELFLKDIVVIYSINGNYEKALSFHPKNLTNYDDVYFWALLSYDAEDYVQVINDISIGQDNIKNELLKADAFVKMNEIELAYQTWNEAMDIDSSASAALMINAARASYQMGQIDQTRKILIDLVNLYPSYVPGLIFYGEQALEQEQEYNEDALNIEVRKTGLKTVSMEIEDSRPRIPVSDALYRMETELQRQVNYDLLVEYTKQRWQYNKTSPQDKVMDMWSLLEHNSIGANKYDPKFLRYVLWFFLANENYNEAERILLANTVFIKLEGTDEKSLGNIDGKLLPDWECEYAAFLNIVLKNNIYKAKELFEYACYKDESKTELREKASYNAILNLANIYSACEQKNDALDLYSYLATKVIDDKTKAEIHYRVAVIKNNQKDTKSALQNLVYCISLNPNHLQARLLLKYLQQE